MKSTTKKFHWARFLFLFLFSLTSYQDGGQPVALAQSEETWSDAINISNSGASSDPHILIDSQGMFHIAWEDEYAGYMYARSNDGLNWSRPIPVSFPFTTEDHPPTFLADRAGNIHAFWTNFDNNLFHSHVSATEMGNSFAWEVPILLSDSAVALDASLDNEGIIHLAFIRNITSDILPAGIYYQQSEDDGASWSIGILLYQSQYFRSASPNETNVEITTAGSNSEIVYVAWDNRALKRVFLARSNDGGSGWNLPQEIQTPAAAYGYNMPFNVNIVAREVEALITWQIGEPTGVCSLYSQTSMDFGITWGIPVPVLENFFTCPSSNEFLFDQQGRVYLVTVIQDQLYLLAWDGQSWSNPQAQRELQAFIDPLTFDTITFQCHRYVLSGTGKLFVVGCDVGTGGDIWLTSRNLGTVEAWFPQPSVWSTAELVASGFYTQEAPVVISDSTGRMHAFWCQFNEDSSVSPLREIYYSSWDGSRWSQPVSIHSNSNGDINNLSVIADRGTIIAVWTVGDPGALYFSLVNAQRANNPSDWTEPIVITPQEHSVTSPYILIGDSEAITITYAVPINEARGIYMLETFNRGQDWSDPIEIFNGVEADWERVGHPRITRSGNGALLAIWSKYPISSQTITESILYTSSLDSGTSWTTPELIIEAKTKWSDIFSLEDGTYIRLWQEVDLERTIIWYQFSKDRGLSWSLPQMIPVFGEIQGPVAVGVSPAHRLFLFQVVIDVDGSILLQNWQWMGENWATNETVVMTRDRDKQATSLSASFSPDGLLTILFSVRSTAPKLNDPSHFIYSLRRMQPETLPYETAHEILPSESPILTPQETQSAAVPTNTFQQDTPTPAPTQTPDLMNLFTEPEQGSAGRIGLIIGGVLILGVSGIVFIFGVLKARSGSR